MNLEEISKELDKTVRTKGYFDAEDLRRLLGNQKGNQGNQLEFLGKPRKWLKTKKKSE